MSWDDVDKDSSTFEIMSLAGKSNDERQLVLEMALLMGSRTFWAVKSLNLIQNLFYKFHQVAHGVGNPLKQPQSESD